MLKPAALLLVACLIGCSSPADELRAIEVEIAQARQEIRNIEADRIRRVADRLATAHQFADQPDVLRPLQASMADTDRQLERVNADLIAGYRRTIEALEARRSAIAGRP